MPLPTNPNLAQTDPSAAIRERLHNDLNIKGLVSFPDKIDMRAILPTYDVAPLDSEQAEYGHTILFPAIFHNITSWLVNPSQYTPRKRKLKLNTLYGEISLDGAGRTALVGEYMFAFLWKLPPTAGVSKINETGWVVADTIPIGGGGIYAFGFNVNSPQPDTAIRPGSQNPFYFPAPIELYDGDGGLLIDFWMGGATLFPANTVIEIYWTWSTQA